MKLRKPTRLKDFDYASNHTYFITLCTHGRQHLLSQVITCETDQTDSHIILSAIGQIVCKSINYIQNQREGFSVEHFVIMPNHVHLLVTLSGNSDLSESEWNCARRKKGVDEVIGAMKSFTQSQFLKLSNEKKGLLWQRSFYDQVIRDQQMYDSVWTYIEENPLKWALDEYN
jgi:REP element-mobilizing transposase RayT